MNYIDIPNNINNTDMVKNDVAINNSLNNIIGTTKGTMPGHPEFGCKIDKYLFELLDPMIIESIKIEVEYAIKRWEPRITIKSIIVNEDLDYNRILINVIYNIKNDITSNEYSLIFKQQI